MEGPTIHEKKIKKQNEGKKLIKTRNQILIPNEDPRRKCDQSFFFPLESSYMEWKYGFEEGLLIV